jgi:hypothetical protein
MGKEMLLNNFAAKGTDVSEFHTKLKELADMTTTVVVSAKELALLSQKEATDTTNLWFYHLVPDDIWQYNSAGVPYLKVRKISRDALVKMGASELLAEYENDTSLMMMINEHLYFTSDTLPLTLSMRSGVAGPDSYIPSVERDIHFAKGLNKDEGVTAVIRYVGGLRKIIATLTSKYTYEPQTMLTDIYNTIVKDGTLGKVECYKWSIDQHLAEIYIEFPEKAEEISALYDLDDKLIPGLYLAKSDAGECSITVRATWRVGASITTQSELKRKHIGNVDEEKILEDVKTTIFDKYTILPETLCDLISQNITDPSWKTSLRKKEFENRNLSTVCEVIKNVFKELEMVKTIGKKHEKELYEQLCDEIDPSIEYTAYDIAMMIMSIPGHVSGLPAAYEPKLAMACGKAPYADYTVTKKTKSKIVLTA